jgi:flagellar biosynthesis protein FlhA
VVEQMTSHRLPLLLTGGLLLLLSFTGLPVVPLWLLASGCLLLGWHTVDDAQPVPPASTVNPRSFPIGEARVAPPRTPSGSPPVTATPYAIPEVELVTLELGVGLLRLVDAQRGGRLMEEISTLRRTILEELGFIVPKILVRDAVELDPREYRIRLRDVPVAQGTAYHDAVLAVDEGSAERSAEGIAATHPATGLAANWIEPSRADDVRRAGWRILQPERVIAEHLHDVVLQQAPELFTRGQLYGLLDQCREHNRQLVEETVPKLVNVPRLHQVLRGLLGEQVPIRDLQSILEALSFMHASSTLDQQIEACRGVLSRSICQRFRNQQFELKSLVLSASCEHLLLDRLDVTGELRLSSAEQEELRDQLRSRLSHAEGSTARMVVIAAPALRSPLSRLMGRWSLPVSVLSRNELTRDTRPVHAGTIDLSDSSFENSGKLVAAASGARQEAVHE